ncbi:capsular polysaccharide transport system permease protein [Amphritea atlantica]|uniref:Capsular polysaccharide transport system permease protein n=1 Tax=Amphritea atlantica TaxID=355243 RepID=A0A1H9K883_9GAMM|nr:chain-length determining protein [Amphritea atlantica]SEQ95436.1 capsular polysaccharide transport system permease protein [Amphritea atlantica]
MKQHLMKNPVWVVCGVFIALSAFYWGMLASDRYVSEANVVLESPQITIPTMDVSSLLGGPTGESGDMLLLRDYLLSVDMLLDIDRLVGFREHYSAAGIDFISALSSADVPIEDLHEYYLKRVSVELDDYANVLRIKVEAFSPEMANKIASLLLEEGEKHMNLLGKRLAEEQVRFLEDQVAMLNDNFNVARNELLNYQNKNGLISPTGTVESISAVVATLEGKLSNLQAEKTMLKSYQSSSSPAMVKIDNEIKAVRHQIEQEKNRMAQQSGNALNTVTAEYQTLELKVKFALDSYSGALAALQSTRIEAARKLKQVSVLQSPTYPEYPLEPQRLHNIAMYAIVALFMGLIMQMLLLIIKDHRD